jgi:transposase
LESCAGSPPALSDRMFIEAVLYQASTGTPWPDLPEGFGQWNAVYNRFRRWKARGSWRCLWERLRAEACHMALHTFIDATVVRTHQHATGALKNDAHAAQAAVTGGTVGKFTVSQN